MPSGFAGLNRPIQQQQQQSQQQSSNEPHSGQQQYQQQPKAAVAPFARSGGNNAAARLLSQRVRAPAPPPAKPASDLDRLIDRKSKKANATEAATSKVRAERAVVAQQIADLSEAPLAQARTFLDDRRACFEAAAAAQKFLELELEVKREHVDELRAEASKLAGRRDALGWELREAAEKHAEALAGCAKAHVEAATKGAGGAFFS